MGWWNGAVELATGGEDALVKLWKVDASGAKLNNDFRDLECTNDREVTCVASANDGGKTIIVAAEGGEVRRIDVATGNLVGIVTRMALGCRDIKVSADGEWLLSLVKMVISAWCA